MKQINGAFTVSFADDTFDAEVQMLHNLHGITMDVTYWMPVEGDPDIFKEYTRTVVIGPVYGYDVMLHPFHDGDTDLMVPIANLVHLQHC